MEKKIFQSTKNFLLNEQGVDKGAASLIYGEISICLNLNLIFTLVKKPFYLFNYIS